MPISGTNAIASIAGAQQAAQVASHASKPKPAAKSQRARRREDEIILETPAVTEAEELHSLSSNDQEDAHEDHQQHPAYTADGRKHDDAEPPRLDLRG